MRDLAHIVRHALWVRLRAELIDVGGKIGKQLATAAEDFTADEVHRLHAGCAFVQHRNARVAHDLLHTPFPDIAMATQNLHAMIRCFKTKFGNEGLGNWGQQSHQIICVFSGLCVTRSQNISLHSKKINEGSTAFGNGSLGQQHASHIGMNQNRIGGALWILRTRQ